MNKTNAVCQECFRKLALDGLTRVKGSTTAVERCSKCGRYFSGPKVLVVVEKLIKP